MNGGLSNQAKSSKLSIESTLDSISNRIDAICALVKELEVRAAFFLGPDAPQPVGTGHSEVKRAASPLFNAIDVLDWKLEDLANQLHRVVNRIEG